MDGAIKIFDWIKAHPGYSWLPAILVLLALLYELAKALLPKLTEWIGKTLIAHRRTRNAYFRVEEDMRRFCLASRNVNWTSSLPAIARYNLNIPLADVFVLPKLTLNDGTGSAQEQEIGEILSHHPILCVTGPPGSGKSTLVNSMAIAFAQEDAALQFDILESRVPLCFDFKEFVELDELTSAPELFVRLFGHHGISVKIEHMHDLLDRGRCAIFLDGLDEAGDAVRRRRTLRWIIEALSAFSDKNRLIVTCRDFEWEAAMIPGVTRAIIQPFSVEDAQKFIANYKRSITKRAGERPDERGAAKLDALVDGLETEYQFLAANPMLLTLTVTLLTLDIAVPRRRADIIATFVRTMLIEWSAVKGKADPATHNKTTTLESVGYHSFAKSEEPGTLTVSDTGILHLIAQDATEACSWLDEIAARSGILVKLGDVHWIFSNRRILEFLVARELSRHADRWRQHWRSPKWKEVFVLLPDVAPVESHYVSWIRQRGIPQSDLHALLSLAAAINLSEPQFAIRTELTRRVRHYVLAQQGRADLVDVDLLRLYVREDWEWFSDALAAELDADPADPFLLVMALRSSDVRACQLIAGQVIQPRGHTRVRLLELLPAARPRARARLIQALFLSDVSIDLLAKTLMACGNDALLFLFQQAQGEGPRALLERAVDLIGRFPDPHATTFLFQMQSNELLGWKIRQALEHNIALLSGAPREELAVRLLRAKPTFYQRVGKRYLDFCQALTVLILTWPILLVTAVVVRLDSPGPILSRHPRIGLNGRLFYQLKFRSMRTDFGFEVQTSRHDSRVTRVGRFIRTVSIDELPTLINVVKGDMAIVGPEPLPPALYINTELQAVLSARVRPGLLGALQEQRRVTGSGWTGDRLLDDLNYITRSTLLSDVRAMFREISHRLFAQGAY